MAENSLSIVAREICALVEQVPAERDKEVSQTITFVWLGITGLGKLPHPISAGIWKLLRIYLRKMGTGKLLRIKDIEKQLNAAVAAGMSQRVMAQIEAAKPGKVG